MKNPFDTLPYGLRLGVAGMRWARAGCSAAMGLLLLGGLPSPQAEAQTPPVQPAPQAARDDPSTAESPPWFRLSGSLALEADYSYARPEPAPGQTDWRGWSALRTTLHLESMFALPHEWKAVLSGRASHDAIYSLRGREHYTRQVLDANESNAEVREAYVQGSLAPSLDFKAGRQVLVWGKADALRVVDVLNPVENRQPGLVDLKDLRLPVTMTRVDAYLGPWDLQAAAIHEVRVNRDPVFGSDFYPVPVAIPEQKPADGGDNTGWAFAMIGTFRGWDLSFHWAQTIDPQSHGEAVPGLPPQVVLRHARLTMGGLAADVALGDWLLRTELAQVSGLKFFNAPLDTFRRTDAMIGVDYSGLSDATVTVEAVLRRLIDYRPQLARFPDFTAEDSGQVAVALHQRLLRDALELAAVATFFGAAAEQGSVQRYSARYELAAGLHITGGVVIYQSAKAADNPLLAAVKDNDRLFAELKWSF
jgi:hypothetical protein